VAGSFLKQTLAVACGIGLFCMLCLGGCLFLAGVALRSQMWATPETSAPPAEERAIAALMKQREDPDSPETRADRYQVVLYWRGDAVPKGNFDYPIRGGFRADALAKVVGIQNGKVVSTQYPFIVFRDDGTAVSPWGLRFDQLPAEYQ
jgi:hypothetical protein